MPKGIVQTAVLKRASSQDILVHKPSIDLDQVCTIATGSLRRKAQWLHRYPHHNVVGLRGNVNTRLQKLADSTWQGAIFAKAGLERIHKLPTSYKDLSWMTPAPAQGAMVVVALENDSYCKEATQKLNHSNSEISTHVEREFLRILEGGCTAPIGALAEIVDTELRFHGELLSLDGKTKLTVTKSIDASLYVNFGRNCAHELLAKDGASLMEALKMDL